MNDSEFIPVDRRTEINNINKYPVKRIQLSPTKENRYLYKCDIDLKTIIVL